jgi:hypothetical protein
MLSLSDIANTPLPAGTKGLPLDGSIVRPADFTARSLNVLRGAGYFSVSKIDQPWDPHRASSQRSKYGHE